MRGWADLVINSSYWLGAALGAAGSILLLDPARLAADLGWRLCFLIGAALGLFILWLRRFLPESPRWLVIHGRVADATRAVDAIEARFPMAAERLPALDGDALRVRHAEPHAARRGVPRAAARASPARCARLRLDGVAGVLLQRIFFTYALVLVKFYGVPGGAVGWYLLPFAGQFSRSAADRPPVRQHRPAAHDRRDLCAVGGAAAVTGLLFERGLLTATTQTAAWTAIFFVASSAASAAYLTVSEVFPLEMRALAIAIFYACGTGIGGVFAPWLFGRLIESGARTPLFYGYLGGAGLMLAAAGVALWLGVAAERRPLEGSRHRCRARRPG